MHKERLTGMPSEVKYIIPVKVVCFVILLQVLILRELKGNIIRRANGVLNRGSPKKLKIETRNSEVCACTKARPLKKAATKSAGRRRSCAKEKSGRAAAAPEPTIT